MENNYAISILKWALYKFYAPISDALAIYQLTEASYNLDTQAGNLRAISDYLHFTTFTKPQIIRTMPDVVHEDNINRNPRKGIVIKADYQGRIIYVEIKHPRYNRSRSQLNLEDRVRQSGEPYFVVNGFCDSLCQLNAWSIGRGTWVIDTS